VEPQIEKSFRVLGLPVNSSFEEVKEAYKDLVNVWHPDRFENRPRLKIKAEEKLKEINEAYERLSRFFKNADRFEHAVEDEYSGPSDRDKQTIDPEGSTVSDESVSSLGLLEQFSARVRWLAFFGAVTVIIGSSIYFARSRRTIPSSVSAAQTTSSGNINQPQSSSTISASENTPLPEPSSSSDEADLTEVDLKEARAILFLIDIMDGRLRNAWNKDNDFGVTTDADRKYLVGADFALRDISKRLDRLPDGKLKTSLFASAVAYKDVGQIRVNAGEENGESAQRQIVKEYGLEKSEPHLWAWRVLEIARAARNEAALSLAIPEKKYAQSESDTDERDVERLTIGRYEGVARNTTRNPPLLGSVVFEVLSIDFVSQTLKVNLDFSNGLCGSGSFSGKLSEKSFSLTGKLKSAGQPCGEQSWTMVNTCSFREQVRLHCTYSLSDGYLPRISQTESLKITQNGSFDVSPVAHR
jgi:curved DNA-binding protein CbpA